MTNSYGKFRNHIAWKVVKKSIDDLKENQDIKITTLDEYVIGYIVKNIYKNFKITRRKNSRQE